MGSFQAMISVFFNRKFRRGLLASLRLRGGRGGFRGSFVCVVFGWHRCFLNHIDQKGF